MKKSFLIFASTLLFIAGLASVFIGSPARAQDDGSGLVTTVPANVAALDSEASIIAAKFTKQIAIVNGVRLDAGLFDKQSFISLVDQSRPIPAEASGRVNPFAPF